MAWTVAQEMAELLAIGTDEEELRDINRRAAWRACDISTGKGSWTRHTGYSLTDEEYLTARARAGGLLAEAKQ
jgi:hypothetical protein